MPRPVAASMTVATAEHDAVAACATATCGRALPQPVAYCPYCGTRTGASATPPASPVQPPASTPRAAAPAMPPPVPGAKASPPPVTPPKQPPQAIVPPEPDLVTRIAPQVTPPVPPVVAPPPPSTGPSATVTGVEPQRKPVGRVPWAPIVVVLVVLSAAYRFFFVSGEPAATKAPAVATSVPAPGRGSNGPVAAPTTLTTDQVLAPIPIALAMRSIDAMLAASGGDQIDPLMAARRELQQIALPDHGDRRAARAADRTGLEALRRRDPAAATTAFLQGVQADPADVEIVDNLSQALYGIDKPPEARMAALGALTLSPERTSAWVNLAIALADLGESAKAVAAFRLAHRFSGDPQKTTAYLGNLAQGSASSQVRDAAQAALATLSPAPVAGPAPAPVDPPATQAPVRTAIVPSSPRAAPAPDPGTPQGLAIAAGMVEEGEACMGAKNYSCAITSARAALKVDPRNAQALALLRRAESEQKQAMDSITIR